MHFLRGFYVCAIIMIMCFVVCCSLYSEGEVVYIAVLTADVILFGISCFVMFIHYVHEKSFPREALAAPVGLFAGSLALMLWNISRFRDLE